MLENTTQSLNVSQHSPKFKTHIYKIMLIWSLDLVTIYATRFNEIDK